MKLNLASIHFISYECMLFTGLLSLLLHFFFGGDSNFISDLETVKQVLDSEQVTKYSLTSTLIEATFT